MALARGDLAPDFELPLKPGEAPLRLSDYRGQKPVVLFFFPQAFSPACTDEFTRLARDYEEWRALGVELIGVSVDSPWVTQRFAREVGAGFPIVSDFNREAMTAYGVRNDDYFGLRGVADRSAFVLDRSGRTVYAWVAEDDSLLPPFEAIRAAVAEAVRSEG